jgi:hypothetical protein
MRLRRGFYPGRNRRQTQERAAMSALDMLIGALRREAAKRITDKTLGRCPKPRKGLAP